MNNDYGRARKGRRIYDEKPLQRGEKINTIALLGVDGIKARFSFNQAFNAQLFISYLDTFILPLYTAQQTLIMDNSPIHHAKIVQQYIKKHHIKVLFLPPYSPELNPIELAFSKIKQQLKFKKPRTFDDLLSAIKDAFDSISSNDAIGFFNHVFQY